MHGTQHPIKTTTHNYYFLEISTMHSTCLQLYKSLIYNNKQVQNSEYIDCILGLRVLALTVVHPGEESLKIRVNTHKLMHIPYSRKIWRELNLADWPLRLKIKSLRI